MMEAYTCINRRAVAFCTTHRELSSVDWISITSQSHYALYGIVRHAAY